MAQQFLRPGPWKLTNSDSNPVNIKIDNEVFTIGGSSSVEFDCSISCSFDDTNITFLRNPVAPVVSTTQTGGITPSSSFGVKTKSKLEVL